MKQIKVFLFLASYLIISSGSLDAQTVNGGIKGGLTMSNFYIDEEDLDDENARFGINAGFFSQIMYFETFGIQPELLYTSKGVEGVYGGVIDQTVKFNLSYIDLPILAVFRPIEVLDFYAGPFIGFLLSSNVEFSGTIDGESEIDRDNLNTFDYGVTAGIAYNFGNLRAGLRYNLGMQNLADSDVGRLLLGDSKNSYGQLYIAFNLSQQ